MIVIYSAKWWKISLQNEHKTTNWKPWPWDESTSERSRAQPWTPHLPPISTSCKHNHHYAIAPRIFGSTAHLSANSRPPFHPERRPGSTGSSSHLWTRTSRVSSSWPRSTWRSPQCQAASTAINHCSCRRLKACTRMEQQPRADDSVARKPICPLRLCCFGAGLRPRS